MDNLESLVISLIFHNKINVYDFAFKKDMFQNKINFEYIDFLKNNLGTSNQSVFDLNQNFLTKSTIHIYDLSYVENTLLKYSTSTILDMFFKQIIESIWEKKKLENYNNSNLEEILDLVNDMRENILSIKPQKEKRNPYEKFRENLAETKKKILSGELNEGITGIKSGIQELDEITCGFKDGEYILIAGRPGMGKTSVALDIAVSTIMQEKSVLFMTLEMPAEQLIARLIPKVNHSLRLENTVHAVDIENKEDEIIQASLFLENSKIEIDDFENDTVVTKKEIIRSLEEYFRRNNRYPDLVIIDYIQIVKSSNNRNTENDSITDISNTFQRLAKKTKSVLCALSQLNRSLEDRPDKRPNAADLRGSGSLEQDADKIIFTYRDDVYRERRLKEMLIKKPDSAEYMEALNNLKSQTTQSAELIVGKNRNGGTGTANTKFHTKTASYTDSPEQFEISDF